MPIDLKTVKHISKLSRISINEEKAKKLEKDLNSIFEFIEKLNKLNTGKVEPLTSIAETTLKLRNDEVKSKNIRDHCVTGVQTCALPISTLGTTKKSLFSSGEFFKI